MRPYVCTFTDCKEKDRLFPSRHDWYSHELAFHRRMWVCISGCSGQFASESAFEAHLRAIHKEFEDTTQAKKYGAHSRQLPEPKISTCPICGDKIRYPELIRTHIGRHQVQLGLWPLRSMRYFEEDDEEDEENVAEINDEEDEDGQVEQEEEAIKVEEDIDEECKRIEKDETKLGMVPDDTPASQDTDAGAGKGLEERHEQAGSDSPPPGSTKTEPVFSYEDYTVGWICARTIEISAALACFDSRHEDMPNVPEDDHNNYQFGQIGVHNIVLGSLPLGEYGPASSAFLAASMLRSFPHIKFGVLVGIGGGVPSADRDIRLGDVAVSYPGDSHGGVIQFDLGKMLYNGTFQMTGFLNRPPNALLNAAASLRAESLVRDLKLEYDIQSILAKNPRMRGRYSRPDSNSDRLYSSSYVHVSQGPCELGCEPRYEIQRPERGEDDDNPAIHYGLIASGNGIVKDADFRDKLAQEKGVICFEGEAAGLMNNFPCIVIQGIWEYCDSHKNQRWQGYAAISAAVYARTLLRHVR